MHFKNRVRLHRELEIQSKKAERNFGFSFDFICFFQKVILHLSIIKK